MKKLLTALALLLALALPLPAAAQYWDADAPRLSTCCNRPGCLVLQTVMLGTFDAYDSADSLSVRVYSAALDRLLAVTDEDIAHFCASYGEDAQNLRACFDAALRNCLRADIQLAPQGENDAQTLARTVLMLFLTPGVSADDLAQRAAIRAGITQADIELIAKSAGLPLQFVNDLLASDASPGAAAP